MEALDSLSSQKQIIYIRRFQVRLKTSSKVVILNPKKKNQKQFEIKALEQHIIYHTSAWLRFAYQKITERVTIVLELGGVVFSQSFQCPKRESSPVIQIPERP